jgi:hypothetical protein
MKLARGALVFAVGRFAGIGVALAAVDRRSRAGAWLAGPDGFRWNRLGLVE